MDEEVILVISNKIDFIATKIQFHDIKNPITITNNNLKKKKSCQLNR